MQTEPKGGAPASPNRPSRGRKALSAAFAAALAVLAFGLLAAAPASAAPSMSVSQTTDLVSGQTIKVSGSGFVAPTPTATGMYFAVAVFNEGVITLDRQNVHFLRTTDYPPPHNPGIDYVIDPITGDVPEMSMTVDAHVRDTGGNPVADCRVEQCFLVAAQAHTGDPVYVSIPLEFRSGRISVSPRSGLPVDEASIVTVAGRDLLPSDYPDGIRIAQGQRQGESYSIGASILVTDSPDPSDPGEFELSSSGFFVADLEVQSRFGGSMGLVSCEYVICEIIAWPEGEQPNVGSASSILASETIGFAFRYNPLLRLSRARNLPANFDLAVRGTGFPAGHPGLYVTQAVVANGEYLTATRDTSGTASNMKFIMPGSSSADTRLNPDGSFATEISVSRSLALENGQTVDCATADCRIIAWRAHTDPSRDTVFTSKPVTFVRAAAPRINVVKRKQLRIGRSARSIALVGIRCGSEACAVRRPNRVQLRVGRQVFRLALVSPRRVADGRRAVVRLRVTGRAARALTGRRARVKFRVAVRSTSGNQAVTVNRALVGTQVRPMGRR